MDESDPRDELGEPREPRPPVVVDVLHVPRVEHFIEVAHRVHSGFGDDEREVVLPRAVHEAVRVGLKRVDGRRKVAEDFVRELGVCVDNEIPLSRRPRQEFARRANPSVDRSTEAHVLRHVVHDDAVREQLQDIDRTPDRAAVRVPAEDEQPNRRVDRAQQCEQLHAVVKQRDDHCWNNVRRRWVVPSPVDGIEDPPRPHLFLDHILSGARQFHRFRHLELRIRTVQCGLNAAKGGRIVIRVNEQRRVLGILRDRDDRVIIEDRRGGRFVYVLAAVIWRSWPRRGIRWSFRSIRLLRCVRRDRRPRGRRRAIGDAMGVGRRVLCCGGCGGALGTGLSPHSERADPSTAVTGLPMTRGIRIADSGVWRTVRPLCVLQRQLPLQR
mmetsp:Transcript_20266/g.62979  ORF Transcript_20266/g.62979 Transcript_20266/m.62979 type:complete len:383 (+) Transcript_20266:478-1626(+)